VHDFLTVGAAAPLQEAGAHALSLPRSYYEELARAYQARRDLLVNGLQSAGFECFVPGGAYYVMTDISAFDYTDDLAFTRYLIEDIGVAVVPGSSFFHRPAGGAQYVRFCFCKRDETLQAATERLRRINRLKPSHSL